MAFTQARAIALINAGIDYRIALETILQYIKDKFEEAEELAKAKGDINDGETWHMFGTLITEYASPNLLLKYPRQSPETLTRERNHFEHFKNRNEAARLRMQKKHSEGKSKRPYNQVIAPNEGDSPFVAPPTPIASFQGESTDE